MWLEAARLGDALNVRVGKASRRFGMQNELLNAAPTVIGIGIGIEPPKLFDNDRLLGTRTTDFIVHGQVAGGDRTRRAPAPGGHAGPGEEHHEPPRARAARLPGAVRARRRRRRSLRRHRLLRPRPRAPEAPGPQSPMRT